MLFNSYSFIFVYLPLVLLGAALLGWKRPKLVVPWLGMASLVFYGVWNVRFVSLLLASIVFNYAAASLISRYRAEAPARSRKVLTGAVATDLILLGYYKYANFFIATVNEATGSSLQALDLILPLGISFFTFTQIAFLVDAYRGVARERSFQRYLLFVTYFPHLIAGPVLHHQQVMPQFNEDNLRRIRLTNFTLGVTIFIVGLAKKVLVADALAEYASPIFNASRDGAALGLVESWIGALAYTCQLYFDFSGYSDMAIGISLMLNVQLPLNFNSPYKATSIIDFWRRWHMTLSAFLRDYLYVPLGGSRRGRFRRYLNLLITMLLGGFWHGAGWTFIVWGALHGAYLLVNHAWRDLVGSSGGRFFATLSWGMTFLAVVVGWVFFRSDNLTSALSMLSGMAGLNGILLPLQLEAWLGGVKSLLPWAGIEFSPNTMPATNILLSRAGLEVALGLVLALAFPNVYEWLSKYSTCYTEVRTPQPPAAVAGKVSSRWAWQPNPVTACLLGALFAYCLFSLNRVSEFLYFQF
jgi:alginate O-acetyltransferase complex protein AlgI